MSCARCRAATDLPIAPRAPRTWPASSITSAMLSVAGDFSHYLQRLGLQDRSDTLRLDSPFDYPRQALLYVPTGLPDPADSAYSEAVVRCAAGLVEMSGGGAFLLFTSHRALEAAARSLRALWRQRAGGAFHLLVQGEAPREQLLREFREHGDAVLLGTASFWEGVDVRGSALRLVVIDRLPFASPDDPVMRARVRQARSDGGNPFQDFQLPEAALALKQGVGRLIRSETDTGVVAVCDPRLVGKGYGKKLLASLPPMRRSRSLLDVGEMFRIILGTALRRSAHEAAGTGYRQRAVFGRAAPGRTGDHARGGDGAGSCAADPA